MNASQSEKIVSMAHEIAALKAKLRNQEELEARIAALEDVIARIGSITTLALKKGA